MGQSITRSLLTQRRNLRTSCLTPSRMEETLLSCSKSDSTANSEWTWPYDTWFVRLPGNWPRSWGPGASTASHNLCKFTNRWSSRLWSTALRQSTTRPKQLWQESMRCRGAFSVNAAFLTKRRSYISTSSHWRLDGTSQCWVWFIVRFSEVARASASSETWQTIFNTQEPTSFAKFVTLRIGTRWCLQSVTLSCGLAAECGFHAARTSGSFQI